MIAASEPHLFDRAGCRWLARLALETNVDLEQLGVALAALDRLPDDPDRSVEVLARFAR